MKAFGKIRLAALCAAVCVLFMLCARGEAERGSVIVSLGDSYSSGEGNEPYYGQELPMAEKADNGDWLAHRSRNAWPGMLRFPGTDGAAVLYRAEPGTETAGDTVWYFQAASGAYTDHFYSRLRCPVRRGTVRRSGEEAYLEAQLSIFDTIPENGTDWVTLTLGGNDAGFIDLLTFCVTGVNVSDSRAREKTEEMWQKKEEMLRRKLTQAYRDIAARAGERARIIVAGYPCLFSENGSGPLISETEAQAANDAVKRLNGLIRECVEKCAGEGISISFVSVEEVFDGHGAGSDDPYLYSFSFIPTGEELALPGVSCRSLHPNEKGQQAYARCVQAEIDRLSAEIP